MSTYPKAPRSPHTSPTTGAIAEELGWTPQSSLGMAHPTRSIRTPTRCFHHLTPRPHHRVHRSRHRPPAPNHHRHQHQTTDSNPTTPTPSHHPNRRSNHHRPTPHNPRHHSNNRENPGSLNCDNSGLREKETWFIEHGQGRCPRSPVMASSVVAGG